jgi:alginate O-acetyltransferase complex protein AlgI
MLFNSIDFAIFLPIVFCLYWVLNKTLKSQNILIVAASYLFYGWWDWRFLSLIFLSTVIDFSIGSILANTEKSQTRKLLLWVSIVVNLGFLGFFKYYSFFLDNFVSAFSFFGHEISPSSLNIILPVGISFYTFQTLSYTIDVYRKKLEPAKDFISFMAFVSFFPQLVAGPIERATRLLPQFYKKRTFDYPLAMDGLGQIIWGLFKKIVIADNCAVYANMIFNNSDSYGSSTLALGALFFTFQIYGDFSGYSDIAIGTARLFGFDLMKNFAFPYFSRDIAEFWRRWHISLSTWFRDYLYIPLGGSRGGKWMQIRNVFAIFIVSGFWHGANWTYIAWGALNAIYFLPLLLLNKNRQNIDIVAKGKYLPSMRDFLGIMVTFFITVVAWIFFRASSIGHAIDYLSGAFSFAHYDIPDFKGMKMDNAVNTLVYIGIFIFIEWLGRDSDYAIQKVNNIPFIAVKLFIFYIIIMAIILFSIDNEVPFIYFQF